MKTCEEILDIKPDSREGMELKQEAINPWQKYEAEQKAREEKFAEKKNVNEGR